MKIKFGIIIFLVAAVLTAGAVDLNIEQSSLVENEASAEEDYIFIGKDLEFNARADNLYFLGQDLDLNGTVESGLTAFGDRVTVNGEVKNDTHIGAQTITVQNRMTGTVFLAANDIIIGKSSEINGDLLSASAIITLDGIVNGDVYIASGKVIINNIINGNLQTGTGKVLFGENGRIIGNMEYSSDWQISDADREKVSGSVEYTEWNKDEMFKEAEVRKAFEWMAIAIGIVTFLSFIIAGLLLLLFPAAKTLEEDRSHKRFLFTSLWGLIPFFIFPVLVIMALILGITTPLGFILLLAGLPVLMVTQIFGITLAGQFLFKLFHWKKKSRHLFFLFGMLAAITLSVVPFLSGLAFVFFSALGWGKILEGLFNTEFGNGKPKTAEPVTV